MNDTSSIANPSEEEILLDMEEAKANRSMELFRDFKTNLVALAISGISLLLQTFLYFLYPTSDFLFLLGIGILIHLYCLLKTFTRSPNNDWEEYIDIIQNVKRLYLAKDKPTKNIITIILPYPCSENVKAAVSYFKLTNQIYRAEVSSELTKTRITFYKGISI